MHIEFECLDSKAAFARQVYEQDDCRPGGDTDISQEPALIYLASDGLQKIFKLSHSSGFYVASRDVLEERYAEGLGAYSAEDKVYAEIDNSVTAKVPMMVQRAGKTSKLPVGFRLPLSPGDNLTFSGLEGISLYFVHLKPAVVKPTSPSLSQWIRLALLRK